MDTRAARRAAEKAARNLVNSRAALVGDLGVMQAERARLAEEVAEAATRGRQLVADAETEAAQLVAAIQDRAQEGEQHYADAYGAATGGGWTAADLTALGFQPAGSSPRRRRPAAAEQPEPAAPLVEPYAPTVDVPAQPQPATDPATAATAAT